MRWYPATVKGRVIASVVLIHAVLMLIIVGDVTYREYRFMKTQATDQAYAVAATLALNAPQWLLSRDLVALDELIGSLGSLKGFYMALVMDASGRVVAASDRRYFNQILIDDESRVLLEPLMQGQDEAAARMHHNLIDVAHPVTAAGRTIGFVRLMTGFSQVQRELTWIIGKGIVYAAVAIVAGALTAWLIMNALAKRVERLTRSASEIARGRFDAPLPKAEGTDELDMLTRALTTMQVTIYRQMNDLYAQNEQLERRVEEEVDKRRNQEQILIQQSKMAAMGEMINAIAHQWRQPLSALVLLVQDIEDAQNYGQLDSAYLHRSAQRALEIAKHMSATIDDFRNFFRPTKELTDFDPALSIDEVLRLMAGQLENHQIVVRFEKPARPVTVHGYPNEFKQVVVNILNNARQAIEIVKKGGTIHISYRHDPKGHCFRICDDGPGIPEALREKVFEPYYTTKLDTGGTGIGLYMSKIIIENNMGGRLEVETPPEGATGACFCIVLPATQNEPLTLK